MPFIYWFRRRATASERGASAVEFAILAPLFFMLVFGMFSGGLAYNEKNELTHAAREAARYGATLDLTTFEASCPGNGAGCWAQNVRDVAINRAFGDLDATIPGRRICIALVQGSESSTSTDGGAAHGHVVTGAGNGTFFSDTAAGNAAPCYDDGGADGKQRVQVRVLRGANLNAILFSMTLTLNSAASAQYETTS